MADALPASLLITPDVRRRLSQRYDEAQRLAAREPTDFAQVHDLLAECLRADPGNILYLDALFANLRRWQPPAKRSWFSGWFSGRGQAAAPSKEPVPSTQYSVLSTSLPQAIALIRRAPDLLLATPRDPVVLRDLALACETCDLPEAEL
jgi:hypothetical protein